MKLRKNLVNLTYFCTAMSLNVSIWRISRDDFNLFFSDRGWYNIDFRSSYQSEYQRRPESSDPLYDSYPNAHVLHYHPQHPYRRSGRSWTQKLGAKKRGRCKLYSNDVPNPKSLIFTKIYQSVIFTLSYKIDWFLKKIE